MFVAAVIAFAGCKSDDDPAPNPTPEPTTDPSLSVAPTTIAATADGGSYTVAVACNTGWTATVNADATWCTVLPTTGNNDGTMTVTVAENPATEARSATITFTSGSLSRSATVSQTAATLILSVNSPAITVANSAGSYPIAVTSNATWTVTVNDAATWCTALPATGTGNGTLTVNVAENAATMTRAATVTLSAGTLSQPININQISSMMLIDANAPRYAASNNVWVFGSQTWSDVIQIPECDVEWTRSSDTEPICYRNTSHYWYNNNYCSYDEIVYNFPYVQGYKSYLCNSQWRVPTRSDLQTLVANFTVYQVYNSWFVRNAERDLFEYWSQTVKYDDVYTASVVGASSLYGSFGSDWSLFQVYVYPWGSDLPIRCVK